MQQWRIRTLLSIYSRYGLQSWIWQSHIISMYKRKLLTENCGLGASLSAVVLWTNQMEVYTLTLDTFVTLSRGLLLKDWEVRHCFPLVNMFSWVTMKYNSSNSNLITFLSMLAGMFKGTKTARQILQRVIIQSLDHRNLYCKDLLKNHIWKA